MTIDMRTSVANALIDLIAENNKIIVIDADLANASKTNLVQKAYNDNCLNVGIAEANMIAVASGLSLRGFIPYVHSFAAFATRRCYDQIYISGGFAQNNIKIIGTDFGVCATYNGGTHTTFEDIALMRMIPNSMVFEPCDTIQAAWLIKELSTLHGIQYIRINRKDTFSIYPPNKVFEIGKLEVLKQGKDVLLIAAGQSIQEAIKASNELEKEGISVEILDAFSLKPFDEKTFIEHIKDKKLIISVENHSLQGGLHAIIVALLYKHKINTNYKALGIQECYGEVGDLDYLLKLYKIDSESIKTVILENLNEATF